MASKLVLQPTAQELQRARDEFRFLLDRRTKESQWQRFFADNPYVLSMSLPLRLAPQEIVPFGRPGRPEPDFIFFSQTPKPIPTYGLIELKRPDSQVISVTRSNVAILSRDAETAIEQAKNYALQQPEFHLYRKGETLLILGTEPHLFVIMGMSAEFGKKLGLQLYREMLEDHLPKNLKLIPYDTLLQEFELQVPPLVHVLVPALTADTEFKVDPMISAEAEIVSPNSTRSRVVALWNAIERTANEYISQNRDAFLRSSYGIDRDWLIRFSLPERYADLNLLRQKIKMGDSAFSDWELEDLSQQLESTFYLIEKNYIHAENERGQSADNRARSMENENAGTCPGCGRAMVHPEDDLRALLCRNCGRFEQWSD